MLLICLSVCGISQLCSRIKHTSFTFSNCTNGVYLPLSSSKSTTTPRLPLYSFFSKFKLATNNTLAPTHNLTIKGTGGSVGKVSIEDLDWQCVAFLCTLYHLPWNVRTLLPVPPLERECNAPDNLKTFLSSQAFLIEKRQTG